MNTPAADLEIPSFLRRSLWTNEQHARNEKWWNERLLARRKIIDADAAKERKMRVLADLETRIGAYRRRAAAGSILPFEENILRGLEAQLEKERAHG